MIKMIFIILLFMCSISEAAPSTVSVVGNVWTGTGAGTKSGAAPLIWDNFNTGSDGDLLTAHGWTKYSTAANGGTLEQTNAYGGSGLSAFNNPVLSGGFNTSYRTYSSINEIYVSWKQRLDFAGGTGAGSIKLLRINDSTDVYSTATNMNYQYDQGADWLYCYVAFSGDGQDYPSEVYRPSADTTLNSGEWYHFEMYKKLSSPAGAENGVYWSKINGVTQFSQSGVVTLATGETATHASVLLGLMAANLDYTSLEMRNDDLYIDNTLSRVEIGNNAVYTNCTHREIQPYIVSWSDTQIVLSAWNYGSFTTGEQAYLFVVDSNGNASAGYPITIGVPTVKASITKSGTGNTTVKATGNGGIS